MKLGKNNHSPSSSSSRNTGQVSQGYSAEKTEAVRLRVTFHRATSENYSPGHRNGGNPTDAKYWIGKRIVRKRIKGVHIWANFRRPIPYIGRSQRA